MIRQLQHQVGGLAGNHRVLLLAGLVASGGLMVSFQVGSMLDQRAEARESARFDRLVDRSIVELQQGISGIAYVLNGVRGLYLASDSVTSADFSAYIQSVALEKSNSCIRGVGVAERLPDGQWATRQYIGSGIQTSHLSQALPECPRLDDALARSTQSPRPVFVRRMASSNEALLVLALPPTPDGTAQFVFAGIHLNSAVAQVQQQSVGLLTVALDEPPSTGTAHAERRDVRVDDAGTVLTLGLASTPEFEASTSSEGSVVAWGGSILSLALGGLVGSLGGTARRAQKLAHDMTAELNRLAMVAKRTTNLVVVTDTDRRIVWVNDAFTRLTGYSLEEARGRKPGDFLQSRKTDPAAVQQVREKLNRRESCRIELLNVGRDGQEYYLDIDIQPSFDADGQFDGFMAIESDITESVRVREKLAQQVERLERAESMAKLGHWSWDVDTDAITWSKQVYAIHRRHPLLGEPDFKGLLDLFDEDSATSLLSAVREALDERTPFTHSLRTSDVDERYLEISGHPRLDLQGRAVGLYGTVRDITQSVLANDALHQAKIAAESALRESEALRSTLDKHSIFSVADASGRIVDVNDSFCAISGYTREELLGQDHHVMNSGYHPKSFWVAVWRTLASGRAWHGEVCNRRKDGTLYWVDSIIAPFRGADGRIEKYVSIRSDITARKAMEEELRVAARTDRLTGLANRALMMDRLTQTVERARSTPGHQFAVLFLDFDHFKWVNDSLGHEVGDLLLRAIADRLRESVRSSDSLGRHEIGNASARFGGDEFVVLLDAIRDPKDAHRVAERLLEVFSSPFQLGKHTVYSTASIGIVTSDLSDGSAEDLLRDADTAMYEAKLAGRGKYVVFDVSMRKRVQHRLNLESDLRQAIDKQQFHLVYQPIVSLATGEVESLEVLVRWQHPERGTVSPAEFVPVAEENGMIIPIGDWVMRTSFEQMARWQRMLGPRAPKGISVNISRNQLFQPDFVEQVRAVISETGVDPSRLHFEVTESAIMKDVGCASRTLKALRAMGIRIEMDDFGTGYSSLACLHQFQLDVLKIDRSFIASIDRGRDFAALVHAVAQLARNLNITVVAEGIETLEQALMLQSLDVEFGQGYLFSKPLSADQVATFEIDRSTLPGQRAAAA